MSVSLLVTQTDVNNADVRNLHLGRWTHLTSHSFHPRHHVNILATFTHHPRIISCLQRPSVALRLEPAILIPDCNQPSSIPTLYRSDNLFQFVRWVLHDRGREVQMGPLAYTGHLG